MSESNIQPADVVSALERNEFVFFYQPIVSLITGHLEAAEALIRWHTPDGRLILPGEFIPIAQDSGLLPNITSHMFPRLLADILVLNSARKNLRVSSNTCADDFHRQQFTDQVLTAIETQQLCPASIQIEITESSVLNGNNSVKSRIQSLVDAGVRLAMDDFGQGFSSIDTLSRWPFHCIKLDQSLVLRMWESHKNRRIIESSLRMAHELGLTVVAEGVETEQAYKFLLHAGCTHVQGMWVSKPLRLADFLQFAEQKRQWVGLPAGLLYMAQLDHIQWRKEVFESVLARTFIKDADVDERGTCMPELDHHKCRLGLWYYGEGRRYAGIDSYDRLDVTHQQLHETARLLDLGVREAVDKYKLTTMLRKLGDKSIEVVSLLQQLEETALTNPEYGYLKRAG